MMQIVRGSAMWITDTAAVPVSNKSFCYVFGIGDVGGIPVLILWTVVFYIVGILIFNKTPFGRHTLATGGNETSAQYSGINTVRVKMITFIMSGVLLLLREFCMQAVSRRAVILMVMEMKCRLLRRLYWAEPQCPVEQVLLSVLFSVLC